MTERTSHLYGLICPKCSSDRFGTLETRVSKGGIKRRRECKDCGARVTTRESVVTPIDSHREAAA